MTSQRKTIPLNVDINASSGTLQRMREQVGAANLDLLVHSHFITIQGEGPDAGRVAYFIRLGGCNLGAKKSCSFCDTKFEVRNSAFISQDRLISAVVRGWGIGSDDQENVTRDEYSKMLVVITGGEPLLHGDALLTFVYSLVGLGITVRIETNGMYLKKNPGLAKYCVASPKTKLIGDGSYQPSYTEACYTHLLLNTCFAVKFLVEADPKSAYHELPAVAGYLTVPVYVSPITVYHRSAREDEVANLFTPGLVDMQTTARNYNYAAELVLKENLKGMNVKLSLQQHLLFGLP